MLKKLLVLLVVLSPLFALSGPPGAAGGGTPPCGPPFGPPCIPIDGGISLLIAAGLAYGGKKAYDHRKRA